MIQHAKSLYFMLCILSPKSLDRNTTVCAHIMVYYGRLYASMACIGIGTWLRWHCSSKLKSVAQRGDAGVFRRPFSTIHFLLNPNDINGPLIFSHDFLASPWIQLSTSSYRPISDDSRNGQRLLQLTRSRADHRADHACCVNNYMMRYDIIWGFPVPWGTPSHQIILHF